MKTKKMVLAFCLVLSFSFATKLLGQKTQTCASTTDKCGAEELYILGADGEHLIKKGESKIIKVYAAQDLDVVWYCGDYNSKGHTRCHTGTTNLVRVSRAPSGREFTVEFYYKP